MPKQTPYLQRRGDTFSFRIAVPPSLRNITGTREFIKSLHTTDKRIAVPLALRLAATAKQLFYDLKENMSESESNKNHLRTIIEARSKQTALREKIDALEEQAAQQLLHIKDIEDKAQQKLEALRSKAQIALLITACNAKDAQLKAAGERLIDRSLSYPPQVLESPPEALGITSSVD